MSTSESNSSSTQEENFKLASAQRQRSILLYDAFCRRQSSSNQPPTSTSTSNLFVKMYDSKAPLPASKLCAVDSSESKFAIQGLETNWGLHKGTVCVRGSDIAYIDLEIKD